MNPTASCCSLLNSNISYEILMHSENYEIMFGNDLTETQILYKVICITIVDTPEEIITRLKYLYACIAFGNCHRIKAVLEAILNVLHYLTQGTQHSEKISCIILELLELIMLTKEMATSWKPLVGNIFKILYSGFRFALKPTSEASNFIENIVGVLPIERTLDIIYGYMITDSEVLDRQLWSLKLLSALAIERGDEMPMRKIQKLKRILVQLTQSDCIFVSTTSAHTLVDLYANTCFCESKNGMMQELRGLTPKIIDTAREYYEKMYELLDELDPTSVEFKYYGECCESDIIEIAVRMTPCIPIELRRQALMDLCSCLIYGNCEQVIKNFRRILQMLMRLLDAASTSEDFVLPLIAFERIFRCKPMKPYWTVYYREILLRIILCYDKDNDTSDAIDLFIQNVADTLPVTETIRIVDTLIATAEYPYNLIAMKILWEVAAQDKLFSKINLDKLLPTVVRTIEDPEKNLRVVAECVIFKLCAKLGELQITSPTAKAQSIKRQVQLIDLNT